MRERRTAAWEMAAAPSIIAHVARDPGGAGASRVASGLQELLLEAGRVPSINSYELRLPGRQVPLPSDPLEAHAIGAPGAEPALRCLRRASAIHLPDSEKASIPQDRIVPPHRVMSSPGLSWTLRKSNSILLLPREVVNR